MILARVSGGLGNQMFQYAAARALAERTGSELLIDLTWFDETIQDKVAIQRPYWLDVFSLAQTTNTYQSQFLLRAGLKLGLGTRPELYAEPHFHYDPGFFKQEGNVILDGNWTSERYFAGIAPRIRQDFRFVPRPNAANQATLNMIAGSTAVSLHVRRGDYVADKQTQQSFGLTPLDYYRAATKLMRDRVKTPRLFVFSDDIDWCKGNLDLGKDTVFVEGNTGMASYEDMRLMSACQHHIIANSTFSWWGAWLGANPDKIVIAPKRWFNDLPHDTSDLIPASWLRL